MEKNYPKVAILPLTYRCNAKCVMCNIWEKEEKKELSFQQLEQFFNEVVVKEHLESVNLTGGEPLLRTDLVEIVEMILRSCPKIEIITINTNGYFTDKYEDIVRRLCALKKSIRDYQLMFYLSIDGLKEVHDRVRGIDGFFDHVMNTVDLLKDLKQKFDFTYSMNFTISKINFQEMDKVFDFITSRGLSIDFTYSMESSTYFGNTENDNIGIRDEDAKEYVCSRLEYYLEQGKLSYSRTYYKNLIRMIHGKKRKIGCIFANEGVFLHPSGDVFRCWAYNQKMGNIQNEPFSKIWDTHDNEEDIAGIKKQCENCYNNCYVNFKRIDSIQKLLQSRGTD